MKQLKYINSQKETIDFRNFDTQIFKGSFHTYEWGREAVTQQYGEVIQKFTKEALKLEMSIASRGNAAAKGETLNGVTEITERDVIGSTPGKLWWGDYYLECFIISSTTEPSESFHGAEKSMTILAPYPFWIKEKERNFPVISEDGSDESFLNYPYTYPYNYAGSGSGATWYVDHYAPSDFKMIIYGPCTDPQITIDGQSRQVFDTVEKGEYIVIESKTNSITKYRTNGTTTNLFDYRNKEGTSIFEKIPSGNLTINRSGNFGFDLTLFLERSEPAW